jgi:polar amino acid transport system permease protein
LVQKVRVMNSASYTALEGYLPLAAAYLAVTLPLSWAARRLERRFAYET